MERPNYRRGVARDPEYMADDHHAAPDQFFQGVSSPLSYMKSNDHPTSNALYGVSSPLECLSRSRPSQKVAGIIR